MSDYVEELRDIRDKIDLAYNFTALHDLLQSTKEDRIKLEILKFVINKKMPDPPRELHLDLDKSFNIQIIGAKVGILQEIAKGQEKLQEAKEPENIEEEENNV